VRDSSPPFWGGGCRRVLRSKPAVSGARTFKLPVSGYFWLLRIFQHHSLPHDWRTQFAGTGSSARDVCEAWDEAYEALTF
jgi:hypothetical protein